MKQEAKLYQEYLEWLKKENQAEAKRFKKKQDKAIKDFKKANNKYLADYKKRLAKYEKKNDDIVKEYESLNWFEKIFIPDPRDDWQFGILGRPTYYCQHLPDTFWDAPAEIEASQEGFMKWLIKEKYKL